MKKKMTIYRTVARDAKGETVETFYKSYSDAVYAVQKGGVIGTIDVF